MNPIARDIGAVLSALGDIPYDNSPAGRRQKSRDFYWYSPVLKPLLDGCAAELIVYPRDEADVARVLRLCAEQRVPVTARGGGTGNYGQSVPMDGGVVLVMTGLRQIGTVIDGAVRVGAGALLRDIEAAVRPQGWELRMFPSTMRTATIGGFVGGGSGGAGSINYGGLRARGNILGVRLLTMEAAPRVLDLPGARIANVQHTYGTAGILTELTLALAPAQPWVDFAFTFAEFDALVGYARALADADGIAKRQLAAFAWPLPSFFRTLAKPVPEGAALGLAMVSAAGLAPALDLLSEHGGAPLYTLTEAELAASGAVPAYEFCYNHTTLQVLKVDRAFTYLQVGFPGPDPVARMAQARAALGDGIMFHLEFMRANGEQALAAIPVFRFTGPEGLAEIVRVFETLGCTVADVHSYFVRDGGPEHRDPAQTAFRRDVDPLGLLNPGKLRL